MTDEPRQFQIVSAKLDAIRQRQDAAHKERTLAVLVDPLLSAASFRRRLRAAVRHERRYLPADPASWALNNIRHARRQHTLSIRITLAEMAWRADLS